MIEKAKHLWIQIDKDSNHLWKHVFDIIILSDLSLNRSSLDVIIDIIQNLMFCQEEINSKENAIDNQHDLPIYRRFDAILTNLYFQINDFDNEEKIIVLFFYFNYSSI